MKARNTFLIYNVGNVVVLLDGKVMEENINHATVSSGCYSSLYSCLAFYFRQRGTYATEVSLLH